MSIYNDVFGAVLDMVEDETGLKVLSGAMPPDESISATIATSSVNQFFTKTSETEMTIVCNSKSADAKKAADWLGQIHTLLIRSKTYPSTDKFQITNISSGGVPQYLGREENAQNLFVSQLTITFFER